VKIRDTYENGTRFEVTYETGVDLVENTEIVKDHTFTSSQSFDEWEVQTNLPNQVIVKYNNVSGFSFIPEETKDRGCMEISYTLQGELPENVEVNVSKPFEYPYFQPPESFYIHESVEVEGAAPVDVKTFIVNEDENESFLIFSRTISPQAKYEHDEIDSANPEVEKNVELSPSQDRVFPSPGNYSFLIQLTFPSDQGDAKVYLDNVNFITYGNVFGILGTDNGIPYPRDLFSLLVYGARVSLLVGTLTALFSTVIGLFLGLVSGYVGGIVDEGIMRFADLLLVLPTLPLFIVLIVSLRAVSGYVSMWNIVIILTFLGWMGFARSVRSMVLSIRERAFIEAAKAAGAGRIHIINRHIIPNVFALVYITLATACPGAIVVEASLSWLGLGDPTLPSWGKVLYDFNASSVAVTKGLTEYWFWVFPACIAIAVLAAAFILVGYALDEILNPRLRERR
jgi:peptide/nickel transport system permease protein